MLINLAGVINIADYIIVYGTTKKNHDENRPVSFAYWELTSTETRYPNIERELLVVVFGCERFYHYIFGSTYMADSDHKLLELIILKNVT